MVGLKDFDMPSCCNSCEHWSFNRDDEPLCDLTYDYISQFDKRLDTCPLVKAISLEKLEQILSEISEEIGTKQWKDYDYCSGLIRAKNIINKAIKEVEQ